MKEDSPKILVLDIETKPMKSYHWRMFKENISIEQMIEPGGILCFAAKWVGKGDMFFFSDWVNGQQEMAEAIHRLISEADAVVSYNGDRFDLPKLNGIMLMAGLSPPPPVASIDLLKTVKYKFGFDSNKLAFIAPMLGVGSKMKHEGFSLWAKVLDGDEKAQKRMQRYCTQDVRVTDKLYIKIRPWITNHPALRAYGSTACPKCQSKRTQKRGKYITACFHFQRFQCQSCGGWFKGSGKKVA
jgi:DNA polymerase elongation subunit (family B)